MEKTIWQPLWEGSEVVLLAFKQCLSTCPTGGAGCPSPLAPTPVASSLAMEPARPIQFVGVGPYDSAWPYCPVSIDGGAVLDPHLHVVSSVRSLFQASAPCPLYALPVKVWKVVLGVHQILFHCPLPGHTETKTDNSSFGFWSIEEKKLIPGLTLKKKTS